jgi:hypothetical protein
MVMPHIPLSVAGIENKEVIRGLIDLEAWFDSLPDQEINFLRNTRKCWQDAYLSKRMRGNGWADQLCNMRLPVALDSSAGTTSFVTGKWEDRSANISALNEAGERHWIGMMAGELNRELAAVLATTVSVGQTLSAVRRQEERVAGQVCNGGG